MENKCLVSELSGLPVSIDHVCLRFLPDLLKINRLRELFLNKQYDIVTYTRQIEIICSDKYRLFRLRGLPPTDDRHVATVSFKKSCIHPINNIMIVLIKLTRVIQFKIKVLDMYLLSGVFISFLWFVVSDYPISMRLSTLEIRSSFISVFLFIDSILKNSATINNNEIKDRNEEPL